MSKKRLHNKKDNDLDAQLDENWEQEASAIGEQTQEIQENLPGEELTLAQEAMADTTVMAEALMAAVPEAIHPANEFIQAPMELEATPAPKKVQSELAELLQTIKTKPISAQSRQVAAVAEAAPQGVASQPQAAAIAPKPARSGSVPTGQKLVGPRQVPVESLGSGVANLLGDAVGGVVKGSLTVASLFSSKKKVAGRGGKGVAVRSGQAGQPQRMNLVTTPTQRSVKKSGEQVGGGLHAVFNGVGQVVMGGVSIITGTAGCLTGAVVCIGQSVVNGFRPNQRKAIKMAQPPAMLANSNNGSAA